MCSSFAPYFELVEEGIEMDVTTTTTDGSALRREHLKDVVDWTRAIEHYRKVKQREEEEEEEEEFIDELGISVAELEEWQQEMWEVSRLVRLK